MVVGLTGCVASSDTAVGGASGGPATDSPTIAPDVPVEVEGGGGANAAPDVQVAVPGDISQYVDTSQEAKNSFYTAWVYEVPTPQDWALDFNKDVYTLGIATCLQRAKKATPAAIAAAWGANYEVTPGGGQAIVASALNTLCPTYNTGYKTYFDRNVDRFMTTVTQKLTFPSNFTVADYGYFMKEVCWYFTFDRGPRSGVVEAMNATASYRNMAASLQNRDHMWIAIEDAIDAGCWGY